MSPTGLYTYPDVVVVCGDAEYEDEELDALLNPTLIVEVLSPMTESYDRGAKFAHYRQLASLKEYVLIAQDRFLVERFSREGNVWEYTVQDSPDDVLRLDSIGCAIPLREIYAKVRFSGEPTGKG